MTSEALAAARENTRIELADLFARANPSLSDEQAARYGAQALELIEHNGFHHVAVHTAPPKTGPRADPELENQVLAQMRATADRILRERQERERDGCSV